MAAAFSIVLLLCAVGGTVVKIKKIPNWVISFLCMAIYLGIYSYSVPDLRHFLVLI